MKTLYFVMAVVFFTGCTNTQENRTADDTASSNQNSSVMKDDFYTHALWQVKVGKTADFIAAWKKFSEAIAQVPDLPPVQGTLIQSLSDSLQFYSFGPWEDLKDIEAMRNNEEVKKALEGIKECCQQAKPGNYKTVMKLSFPGTRK